MKKKHFFIAAFTLTALLLIAGCTQTPQTDTNTETNTIPPASNNENTKQPQMVGNDRDEHGCIGSAGYSWCEAKQKCIRPWEEECKAEVEQKATTKEELIAKKFAEKYNKPVSDITINLTQQTNDHVRGMISFAPAEPGNSAMFLAAKVSSEWQIVFDGNGSYSCQEVEQYNFPDSMVEDCFNQ
jgi:outer membrane lipoprotein-sorting protein